MTAMNLIERLLQMEPRSGSQRTQAYTALPPTPQEAAEAIVGVLLGDVPVCEAGVYRPRRGQVWVASFTGPTGGQTWRSTGLTDRTQALLRAKNWEAKALAQRTRLGPRLRKPNLRVGRGQPGVSAALLSQKEVAQLLRMSERGVRAIERRAFQKIRNHPLRRRAWNQYLSGELEEHRLPSRIRP
jgi:hypothetical protein